MSIRLIIFPYVIPEPALNGVIRTYRILPYDITCDIHQTMVV
jgi:hypothetical protein